MADEANNGTVVPPRSLLQLINRRSKNKSKKGKKIFSAHYQLSLSELLNEPGDLFPNNTEFDSFIFTSTLDIEDLRDLLKYRFPPGLKLMVPTPGDRMCNWCPENLFAYKSAITSGLRFPVYP